MGSQNPWEQIKPPSFFLSFPTPITSRDYKQASSLSKRGPSPLGSMATDSFSVLPPSCFPPLAWIHHLSAKKILHFEQSGDNMATSRQPIPEPDQKRLLGVSDLDREECCKDEAEAVQHRTKQHCFFHAISPLPLIIQFEKLPTQKNSKDNNIDFYNVLTWIHHLLTIWHIAFYVSTYLLSYQSTFLFLQSCGVVISPK